MTLAPVWRTRLFAVAGSVLAVVIGVQIANESFFWASLCLGACAALVVRRMQTQPLDAVMLGAVLVGYIAGNRGFAQFSFSSVFPLLPAEVVLLVAGVMLLVSSVQRHELPWRRDALNTALLLWMLAGTIRVLFGARAYGFAAARDYALVYYGGFFFLAQHLGREAGAARFLHRCLLAACALLLVIHPLFSMFPDFFLNTLTMRGVPLIFYKDDLAGNFMAMGSLLFYFQFERTRKLVFLGLSLALAALMITTNSRSSMVGLAVGAAWLVTNGRWKFPLLLSATGVAVAIAIFFAAYFRNQSWEQTPLQSAYERTMSIVDPQGQRTYQAEDIASKGDNNVFRMVWWRAAINEAVENNAWFGLGFGYDLADRFVRQYFPDSSEDFTARSPHNVLITVFARMGIVGSLPFLAFLLILAVNTFRALRGSTRRREESALWCASWVVFTCACFGVVLEGPMGAVVFWTLLGLANGARLEGSAAGDSRAALQPAATADEVAAVTS